ncbi:ThuA domain-containing protein [Arthrobacter sp. B1805]|uniref:ThuA domain-containing protein n=1 Tax=Arthrobacter sp. B1805 TaxID=2058892 RepID=UPI000CE4A1FD|nr:ThuA domain-containing protein [Arthrobacter sp. B1805]
MSRILVFSRTCGYRHESIPDAIAALTTIAHEDGHLVEATEDPSVFEPRALAAWDVVVWVSTSGEVLDGEQRRAFADWLRAGGSYAGVHSATACEYEWDEYERIAGAVFTDHPQVQEAVVRVADPDHPSTVDLPPTWRHRDEWYNFRRPPRDRTVLLTVDEESYTGGTMGPGHPVAWHGSYGSGQTWYTSLGHDAEAYTDPLFCAHLRGGLRSLLG